MTTVPKELADEIVKCDGYYMDDPRVVEITEYYNAWGGISYGLTYRMQDNKYIASDFVKNPRIYWRCKDA